MVPPFVGVALNVTEAPVQIVVAEEVEIVTEGVTAEFTVMAMPLETTGVVLAQAAFEVISTVTEPLVKVVLVNVGEFVPTTVLPTFHW